MSLFERLPEEDVTQLHRYLDNYGDEGNGVISRDKMDYFLRFWSENKEPFFHAFGEQFIVKKEIRFVKDSEELADEMYRALCCGDVAIREFISKYKRACQNIGDKLNNQDIAYQMQCFVEDWGMLVNNVYTGPAFTIPANFTKNGRPLVVNHNCKMVKMLGKIADAIGAENVFGVSMPSHITSKESKSDAEQLARNLGINFTEAPIRSMIDTTTACLNDLFKTVETKWDGRYKTSFTPDNIQARSRAMFLWGISNEFASCIPIATSDKSELYMGYATINGDMSGGFAPIADVPKTKLFAFARWMNVNREVKNAIPEAIILKKPGAELAIDPKTGKPLIAEDALMPYEFLDEIIWRIENKHEHYWDLMSTTFQYEKTHDVSEKQKAEWLDKFYRRMSTALYKWSILPPSVIVESRSINKYDYKQPITSSRINYKGETRENIHNILRNAI